MRHATPRAGTRHGAHVVVGLGILGLILQPAHGTKLRGQSSPFVDCADQGCTVTYVKDRCAYVAKVYDAHVYAGTKLLSPSVCAIYCHSRKAFYFGLFQGDICWCGSRYQAVHTHTLKLDGKDAGFTKIPAKCNLDCPGDRSEKCGSKVASKVFILGLEKSKKQQIKSGGRVMVLTPEGIHTTTSTTTTTTTTTTITTITATTTTATTTTATTTTTTTTVTTITATATTTTTTSSTVTVTATTVTATTTTATTVTTLTTTTEEVIMTKGRVCHGWDPPEEFDGQLTEHQCLEACQDMEETGCCQWNADTEECSFTVWARVDVSLNPRIHAIAVKKPET